METVADRYEIEREIGRGGMGVVFLARDITLGRRVALKKLTIDAMGTGAEEATRRFMREARLTSQLSHHCIVNLFDVLEVGNELFIVLEYYESESLAARIDRTGPMGEEEVRRLGTQVASALAYAHTEGVVHRDVKPDNILLGGNGAKLTDFGIARLAEGAQDSDTKLTQTGFYVGTPGYMSPEQIRGDQASAASDVFSVALMLYFALSGTEPFGAGPAAAVLYRIVHEPLDLDELNVSAELKQVIGAASGKEPADRPGAAQLAVQLGSGGAATGAATAPADAPPAGPAPPAAPVPAGAPAHPAMPTAAVPPAVAPPPVVPAAAATAPPPAVAPPRVGPPMAPHPPGPPPATPHPPVPPAATPHPPAASRSSTPLIVALIVVLVIAVGGVAAVVISSNTDPETTVAYTSPQGFETLVPAGWQATYDQNDRADLFTAKDADARVFVGKLGPARSDLQEKPGEQLIADYIESELQLGERLEIKDDLITVDNRANYNGNPGVSFEIVVVNSSTRARYTGELYVFNTENWQWAVLNAAPEGSFESFRQAFGEIEGSFEAG